MTMWLPRGLAFAAGMVLVRLVQGALINTFPTNAGAISLLLVVLFGIGAFAWALLDGMADARANADPDRRRDLAMRWLLAGLFAGVVSGFVVWIISLIYHAIYADGIVSELTVFAAFTTLLVFLPAMLAVSVGRWMVDRNRPPEARRRVTDGAETDVFDAVRDDEPMTGPIAPLGAAAAGVAAVDHPEARTSPVALAERELADDATEQIVGQIHDETERIEAEIDDIQSEGDSKH